MTTSFLMPQAQAAAMASVQGALRADRPQAAPPLPFEAGIVTGLAQVPQGAVFGSEPAAMPLAAVLAAKDALPKGPPPARVPLSGYESVQAALGPERMSANTVLSPAARNGGPAPWAAALRNVAAI